MRVRQIDLAKFICGSEETRYSRSLSISSCALRSQRSRTRPTARPITAEQAELSTAAAPGRQHRTQGFILPHSTGPEDAQSALARKVAERLQEPAIPIKLKCLRLISLLAEDSSPHFKMLKHDATSLC